MSAGHMQVLPPVEIPAWMRQAPLGRALLCAEADWLEASAALVADDPDYGWNLHEDLNVGDLIVTVLECDPPLVGCVERVDCVAADGTPSVSRFVVPNPILWHTAVQGLTPESALASGLALDASTLVEAITRQLLDPPATQVTFGSCQGAPSSWHVAALLAAQPGPRMACAVCDEPMHPSDAIAHRDDWLGSEDIRNAVRNATFVCPPCDELLHLPSVARLRRLTLPQCPGCGLRDYVTPIVYGMPAGPPQPDDNIVWAGCTIPSNPVPSWYCRACQRVLTGTESDRTDHPSLVRSGGDVETDDDDLTPVVPLRRRDRPLLSLTDVGRALRRDATVLDIEDVLDDYADGDVFLKEVDADGFEMHVGHISIRLDYPFTIGELWRKLDELIEDRDAAQTPEDGTEEQTED